MGVCYKCSANLEEGSQFCSECGARQEAAYTMNSNEKAQAVPPKRVQVSDTNNQSFKVYMGQVLGIVKGMLLSPVSTVRSVAVNPYGNSSFILAGLLGIIQGLLFVWGIGQTVGKMLSMVGSVLSSSLFGGSGGLLGANVKEAFKIPYFRIFFVYLLMFIIALFITYIVIYFIGRVLLKGRGNMTSLWSVTVSSAVPYTVCILIGIILSYLCAPLGMVVVVYGALISMFCLYCGTEESMGFKGNSTAITVSLAFAISALVLSMISSTAIGRLMTNMIMKNITG